MRRYLAYRPDEVPRTFRMLDLMALWTEGHSTVHLLLISAAELCFTWDGSSCPLLPLRMLSGPVQHFQRYLKLGNSRLALSWRTGRGFEVLSFLMLKVPHKYPFPPTRGERDKMLLRSILSGGVWFFFWVKLGMRTFGAHSVVVRMEMGISFGILPPLPSLLPLVHAC